MKLSATRDALPDSSTEAAPSLCSTDAYAEIDRLTSIDIALATTTGSSTAETEAKHKGKVRADNKEAPVDPLQPRIEGQSVEVQSKAHCVPVSFTARQHANRRQLTLLY